MTGRYDLNMGRKRSVRTALTIAVLVHLGFPGTAQARTASPCTTPRMSPARLLRDIPTSDRNLLPLPLYGVPKLFVSEPHFTKTGSEFQTGLAVWKGSDEELVARGTERSTGRRGTFVLQRGAALRGLQYVPTTLPVRGCWAFVLKTKSAKIAFQVKV